MNIPAHSFISKYNRRSRVLINKVHVTPAFDPLKHKAKPPYELKEYDALWDTGASGSVITKKVVTDCNLIQSGIAIVSSATEENKEVPTYIVNLFLPNRVAFSGLRVTEGTLKGNIEVLIGMDIIGQGDFAVNNKNNKTTFSYRYPSIDCIDFTELKEKSVSQSIPVFSQKISRNSPCPCGSNKKYKKCCGANK